jgi:hypothetical protein
VASEARRNLFSFGRAAPWLAGLGGIVLGWAVYSGIEYQQKAAQEQAEMEEMRFDPESPLRKQMMRRKARGEMEAAKPVQSKGDPKRLTPDGDSEP